MGAILGKKRELTFWGTVAGLLPLAHASSFAAIGPTTAEGCSGAAGEWREGITRLWSFETETHVARDGFNPFRATAANMKQSDVLARITVEVRGADGELVPGETVVISVTNHDEYGANLVLGWSATGVTRADGEELAFHAPERIPKRRSSSTRA